MADRKVINKYYPPDFDPALIPRAKKAKNRQAQVNMMMPMSVTCKTCGTYIYRGTKFNAKKETVQEEDYLGIKIFRFYMRCPNCSAEFTIKTDPKHADYVVEHNCARQVEPWKEEEDMREALLEKRMQEEGGDAMKELESKTLDSKMEMDILDGLEEMRAVNARAEQVDVDALLAKRKEQAEQLAKEDQELLQETFEGATKRLLHLEDDVDPDVLLVRRKRPNPPTTATTTTKEQEDKKPPQRKLKLVDY